MAGKDIEIDVEFAQIERAVRHTLRPVEHDFRPDPAGRGHDPVNVGHGAGHIRAMGERDEPTSIGEHRIEALQIQPSLRRHRQESQHDTASFGELLPRHEVAVVLEYREHDLVAGLQEAAEGISQQVDRRGRAVGEHDFLVGVGVEEARNTRPRLMIGIGGRTRACMHPFVHIGAGIHLEPPQSAQHDLRHLGCCRIVQIVELRVGESRKFPLQSAGIKQSAGGAELHGARHPD